MYHVKGEKTTDELAFPDVNNFLYTSPTVESLDVICEPVYPDVETTEFNIVRIKTIKAEELVKL